MDNEDLNELRGSLFQVLYDHLDYQGSTKEIMKAIEFVEARIGQAPKGLNENNVVLAVDSDRLAEIVLEKLKPKIDEIILESMLNSMRIQEHIREAEESWED